jgi:hypothetical protein
MTSSKSRLNLFPLSFEPATHRRIIAGNDVVLHCHHYNARLQNLIEGITQIHGKEIFLRATEEAFSNFLSSVFSSGESDEQKWSLAADLYTHLGFGMLDLSDLENEKVRSPMSHFVEGYMAGFHDDKRKICTFTEGYLQGAIHAISGKAVRVEEHACMNAGADACEFTIKQERDTDFPRHEKRDYGFSLIPMFNVYLANMPADFYTLLCLTFLEEMDKINMRPSARKLLIYAGEICALNTLRGIKNSAEWDELIKPMIKQQSDNLYGLIAVTNALGWGNWHVQSHEPGETLEMVSTIGYEAIGHLKYRGYAKEGQCCMMTGVAAGIMAMLYREGTVEERVGTFYSEEDACICCKDPSCHFHIEAL